MSQKRITGFAIGFAIAGVVIAIALARKPSVPAQTDSTESAMTFSVDSFVATPERTSVPNVIAAVPPSGPDFKKPLQVEPDLNVGSFEQNYFAPSPSNPNLEQEALDRSISKLIGDAWSGPSDVVEGSWEVNPPNADGSYSASFKTLDGNWAFHFFDPNGVLKQEHIEYGKLGKLTKWFAHGDERDNIVEFSRGDSGVQRRYYPNGQKRSAQFWTRDQTKASMNYD